MTSRTRTTRRSLVAGMVGLALTVGLGANAAFAAPASTSAPTVTRPAAPLPKLPTAPVVRIGFFANVTHAPALVAQQLRLFETFLGKDGTKVEYVAFNAGPAAIEAMKGGAIDISYIGPNPSISGYTSTGGTLLRVVSGATSGGAQFVVKPGISSVADLKGKTIATPQLGNTQDVALRSWLKENGLSTSITGGGDVTVVPTENATTLHAVPRGGARRCLGAGALGLAAGARGRRQGVLWTRSRCGRTASSSPRTSSRRRRSWRSTPARCDRVLQANDRPPSGSRPTRTKAKDVASSSSRNWTGKPLTRRGAHRAWGNLRFTWDPLPRRCRSPPTTP